MSVPPPPPKKKKIHDNLIKSPVPVVGMFSGNSISAIVVSVDYVLKEFVCV